MSPRTNAYTRCSIDLETRSACDLIKAGAHAYARHPTTDVLVACYAFDDGAPRTWIKGDPVPSDLADYVLNGDGPLWAFNAMFEANLWAHVLGPKYGWPVPALERWHCTAAQAAAMALPRRLGDVVKALGLDEEKDDTGRRIMLQLSKPRSKPGEPLRWWEPADVPAKFERLYAYCANDVVIERAAQGRMRPLSPNEREIWLENCRANERGLPIDLDGVKAALTVVAKCLDTLNAEMSVLTRHRVGSVSQVAQIAAWLAEQGVVVESLDKAHLKDALLVELPPEALADLVHAPDGRLLPRVRRVLEIRQEAAKSSTAKLKAFLASVCDDGRIRGTIRYHAASTGRDGGEIVQPQNFPRPMISLEEQDAVFEAMKARDPAWLELWGPPLTVISWCLRGMICAPEGELIYTGDLSNIEGRVAAWLGGEQWKLDAFRAYDAGVGPDLYKVGAGGILGKPPEAIDEDERQGVGKVSELSLQFQGGHGAFITMGANYGVTPAIIAPIIEQVFPAQAWTDASERYEEKNRYELPRQEWVALRLIIDAWRAKHPGIVEQWAVCEAAAINAVLQPGKRFVAGRMAYACAGGVLWCQLPDTKLLAYVDPQMKEVETPWGSTKLSLTYMSLNSMTRRYERTKSYGGLLFQNGVQAIARQLLKAAELRFVARGWPVILKVHDELVCSMPAGVSPAEYAEEMSRVPEWAAGLPISAKAGSGRRYGK